MLLAESLYTFQELLCSRVNTTLALNGLQNYRTGMLVELSLYAIQIVVIGEADAADQRKEGCLLFFIAGDGEGSHAPSVEGMVHGNDFVIIFSVL